VRNQYIGNTLQFIAGLGPRKASGIQQAIESHGEYISNRNDLITEQIMTKNVFMNSASFLIIPYDFSKRHETEVLDSTRIHPEDYELARKMAADALELDEEDVADYESSGGVVAQLVNEGADKLNDLILEEYAQELERKFNQKKLHTLQVIRSELQDHYGEKRDKLRKLTDMDVFTMLTGETEETLRPGAVVPVVIRRVGDRYLSVRLSCGVEGNVGTTNVTDKRGVPFQNLFSVGQTVSALVLELSYRDFNGQFSTREGEVSGAVESQKKRPTNDPLKWNIGQEIADKAKLLRIQEQQQGRTGRIINHPLFRPFNSRQAEEFLAPLQPGDLVIRPSSRGFDHIAITWKVADQLYQHVDVLEVDKPSEYALGRTLQVGKSRYSDLDELIIMHIKAMARKVEEMMQSDKFHKGTRAQIDAWFDAYTRSGTRRSTYAFCLDHKHPGYFLLCFKTSEKAPVQSWNVKVIPNGYELLGSSYADVPSLSNGFKKIFMHKLETQNQYRRQY
jgi:transcription elongation factor SPT6